MRPASAPRCGKAQTETVAAVPERAGGAGASARLFAICSHNPPICAGRIPLFFGFVRQFTRGIGPDCVRNCARFMRELGSFRNFDGCHTGPVRVGEPEPNRPAGWPGELFGFQGTRARQGPTHDYPIMAPRDFLERHGRLLYACNTLARRQTGHPLFASGSPRAVVGVGDAAHYPDGPGHEHPLIPRLRTA